MGSTIEFYSADSKELVKLFSLEDEQIFFDHLKDYPVADFSLHLLIPEDMDRLCQTLRKLHFSVSPHFRDVLVKQLWYDGVSESLTLISNGFVSIIAGLSDSNIESIASDWNVPFDYKEPLRETPAFKALLQLRQVAKDAIAQKRSLILHLLG